MTIRPLYPAVEPTLNLDFANTKRLDPRISFSRASAGTYFGADGLLKSATVSEARFDHNPVNGESLGLLVEEARTNSQTNSTRVELFTPYELSIIPNALLAPDGSLTGCALIGNTANSYKFVTSPVGFSVSGTTYSFSFYAKSIGNRTSFFVGGNSTAWGTGSVTFDLSAVTATATESFTGSITAAGNGWYRCVATRIANASGYGLNVYLGTFQGDGVSGIGIWGLQAEAGSFPTSYIPTPATFTGRASTATFYDSAGVLQTAASGVARSNAFFPDSNGVMRPAGLLLEAAGTNLVTYSEQFDQWSNPSADTINTNAATAPDGTTTADRHIPSTSSALHYLERSVTTTAATHTLSIYAKASGYNFLEVTAWGTVWSGNVLFNVGTGSFVSGSNYLSTAIQPLPNSWYRVSVTFTASAATNVLRIRAVDSSGTSSNSNFTGNGTSGVLLWGAQLEASPYSTSYIPTVASTVTRAADTSTSATVTRSADTASFAGVNFSNWFNQTEGTIYTETSATSYSQGLWRFIGSTRWYALSSTASFYSELYDFVGGGGAVTAINGLPTSNKFKTIATVDNNSLIHKACMNGGVVTNNNYDYQFNLTQMSLGFISDFPIYMNSRISRLTYWPVRLSDAILQSITR